MTLEERLRSSLSTAHRIVPAGTPVRRPSDRQTAVPRAAIAAGALVLTAAGLLTVTQTGRSPLVVTSSGVEEFVLGGRSYPVERILQDDPLVVLPALPPTPQFDTSPLGPELTLATGGNWSAPEETRQASLTAYIGDAGGGPVLAYQRTAFSPLGFVLDIVTDGAFNGVVCTIEPDGSQGCTDADARGPGGSGGGEFRTITLLTPDVAVVAWQRAGVPIGWTRPRGGVAVLEIENPAGLTFTFLDASGEPVDSRIPG